jgi:ubiquinone/menaquinone biosynthesis C-methylase UbiE
MKHTDYFSNQSSEYAASRPSYPDELIKFIATTCSSQNTAVDCATGNGQAANGLAKHFKHVVAFDQSLAQVSKAAPAPNINYMAATTDQIPLQDHVADLIVAAQAWHWFDKPRFEEEVARVLRPGGRVAIWGYNLLHMDSEMDRLIRHLYTEIVGPYWPKERLILEEQYRLFPLKLKPIPTPEFTMDSYWDRTRLCTYIRSWSATALYIAQNGEEKIKEFEIELSKLWPVAKVTKLIQWPFFLKMACHY